VKIEDLAEVNYRINQCPYKPDPPNFDDWRSGPDGCPRDCDSYAVGKIRALFKRGWPISAMRLAVCTVDGGGHCVVIVATDKGDVVLSNGFEPFPVADMERLGWVPVSIQESGGSPEWVRWTGWASV